ncbi:hypothetical protein IFM12275_22500 [Nocardia sputorum]|nr:hypothetical protein IFM12275_22500 [Nocardia sputorum]
MRTIYLSAHDRGVAASWGRTIAGAERNRGCRRDFGTGSVTGSESARHLTRIDVAAQVVRQFRTTLSRDVAGRRPE